MRHYPTIGRDAWQRSRVPRTCIEAFGSPFEPPRARRIHVDVDAIVGVVLVVTFVVICAGWVAGWLR